MNIKRGNTLVSFDALESLTNREILNYAEKLGIDITNYAEEIKDGEHILTKRKQLISVIIERQRIIMTERCSKKALNLSKKANLIAALACTIAAISLLVSLTINRTKPDNKDVPPSLSSQTPSDKTTEKVEYPLPSHKIDSHDK